MERGPRSLPLGGAALSGTYRRTCRGSSGLGSTPPPGQCPCHTARGGSGSSHTLHGGEAGDTSAAGNLERESSEMQHQLRREYLQLLLGSPQFPQTPSWAGVQGRSLGSRSVPVELPWEALLLLREALRCGNGRTLRSLNWASASGFCVPLRVAIIGEPVTRISSTDQSGSLWGRAHPSHQWTSPLAAARAALLQPHSRLTLPSYCYSGWSLSAEGPSATLMYRESKTRSEDISRINFFGGEERYEGQR